MQPNLLTSFIIFHFYIYPTKKDHYTTLKRITLLIMSYIHNETLVSMVLKSTKLYFHATAI